jgi:hypothetical protein
MSRPRSERSQAAHESEGVLGGFTPSIAPNVLAGNGAARITELVSGTWAFGTKIDFGSYVW